MGSHYESLFLYTKIRWLARNRVLATLYELRDKLKVFQMMQMNEVPTVFSVLHDE